MIAPARLSLSDLIALYTTEELVGRSPATAEQYAQAARLFTQHLGRPAYVDDLTKPVLSDFRAARFSAGKSPATCNKDQRHLAALANYAWNEGLGHEPPRKLRALAEPTREPIAWSLDELSAQLTVAGGLTGFIGTTPRSLFWPALLLTCYDSGGRIAAVMKARAEDFSPREGILLLRSENQKQRAEQRVRLSPQTAEVLDRLLDLYAACLFPWPYDSDGNYRILRKHYRREILAPANLPRGRRDLFHKLRRTTATGLANATDEETARAQLGHSHISVTRRYLDRSKMRQTIQAADVLPRPALPGAVLAGERQHRLF